MVTVNSSRTVYTSLRFHYMIAALHDLLHTQFSIYIVDMVREVLDITTYSTNICTCDVSKLLCTIMRAVQKTTPQNTNTIMELLYAFSCPYV